MKFTTRFIKMNQGTVMLQRWLPFWWRDYEPFVNRLRAKEAKLLELHDKFVKEYDEYRALQAQQRNIIAAIDNAKECKQGEGPEEKTDLPLFSFAKKEAALVPDRWRVFAKALKGGPSLSDTILSDESFNIVSVGGRTVGAPFDGAYTTVDDVEVAGERTMPVVRQSGNQSRKQRQQNNQQNNGHQQNNS